MLLVPTYLSQSSIHGVGLFAKEDIRAGTIIWEFTPHFDVRVPISNVRNSPANIKDFLSHYAYLPHDNPDHYVICMDNARFINHSDNPNTDDTTGLTIANKDIKRGEEIVSNYAEFDAEFESISSRHRLSSIQSAIKVG
ncbi:MAG: SET domain-containing protein [Nitrospinae bacterium]|nr:SET domain-containing protein [Nitrospinota bacterium]